MTEKDEDDEAHQQVLERCANYEYEEEKSKFPSPVSLMSSECELKSAKTVNIAKNVKYSIVQKIQGTMAVFKFLLILVGILLYTIGRHSNIQVTTVFTPGHNDEI